MAQKRMFDISIINQDSFYDLPMEAKALYFLLGMEADDEGFINPKKILRLYGGTEDSIKILIAKKYLIPFESGVVVITDWNRNNYLQGNRIKSTIYVNEKSQIYYDDKQQKYSCLTDVKPTFNNRLERIEENSIEENSIEENSIVKENNKEKSEEIYEISTLEEEVDVVVDFWNNNFHSMTPIEYQKIQEYKKEFCDELIIKALEICVEQNKRTFAYLKGVLLNFKKENIKSINDIQEKPKQQTKKNKKEVPEWFDEKNEREEATEEEQNEMKNILAEIANM